MYIQEVMSQKYATKLEGGLLKGVLKGILGIEGQKKLWKNQFYRLLKSIFFLMPLVQIWCNSPKR